MPKSSELLSFCYNLIHLIAATAFYRSEIRYK